MIDQAVSDWGALSYNNPSFTVFKYDSFASKVIAFWNYVEKKLKKIESVVRVFQKILELRQRYMIFVSNNLFIYGYNHTLINFGMSYLHTLSFVGFLLAHIFFGENSCRWRLFLFFFFFDRLNDFIV